jgi:hypothetical protein
MKPTIFFSHSSLDKDRLLPIRNRILEGTGNAIDVFMSSDGASIPFGKNWLNEIEQALHECKLMFVWITPNSLRSNWIYFESGCAYSRGVKVIPIGYDGVKLENLTPPLSILQGFNILSPASLNNIIAIINREFDLSFPELFDDDFYSLHVQDATSENSPELLEYVDAIVCTFHPNILTDEKGKIKIKSDWLEIFRRILNSKGMSYTEEETVIFGMGYKMNVLKSSQQSWPKINMDPLALNHVWDVLRQGCIEFYGGAINTLALVVKENPRYSLPDDHSLIGSRLIDTEVKFETIQPHVLFSFRNIQFRVNINDDYDWKGQVTRIRKELVLVVDTANTTPIPLLSLMKLLANQKVIQRY